MKIKFLLVVVLVAAAFAGGGYYLGQRAAMDHRMSADKAAAAAPASKTDRDRAVLYWHDPMVPGPKFDKPGKSPFMDMQLVPVYADEGSRDGGVSINPRTVQNLGIRTVEVKQGAMEQGLSAVGAVSVDERSIAAVQSRVSGYVEKLHARAQYDPVRRGQPLVEIYAPDWLSAQEEYLALKRAGLADDAGLLQAARQRLQLLGISAAQIARSEKDGKASARVTLYSPIDGLVWKLGVRDGEAVNPGTTLFELAGLQNVWVNAEIPEGQVALVEPGAAVEARAVAVPDKVFKGEVAAILPEIDAATRTIKARIVLANPGGQLKPGMFARLSFSGAGKSALMVPSEAVIRTGKRTVVIALEDENLFRPLEVVAGRESGDMTEIKQGLTAGQRVVASGQFLIDSEASLKSTLDRMGGAAENAPLGEKGGKP